jgi:predicted ester cyclase
VLVSGEAGIGKSRLIAELSQDSRHVVRGSCFEPDHSLPLAPDFVYYGPAMLPEVRGREAFKQTIAGFRVAFPDLREQVLEQFIDGDRVISRFRGSGTFMGEMMGAAGTGKAYGGGFGIDICRIEGGQVVEMWAMFDTLAMLQQIGLMPSPEHVES